MEAELLAQVMQQQQEYDDQRASDMAAEAGLECHGQYCIEAKKPATTGLA